MTTKEQIIEILEQWGFPVLKETESSVVFRYQMNFMQANVSGDDGSDIIAITLCGLFTAENEHEMTLGLRTCNDLNCNLLHVKLYIDSDFDLVIASEYFHKSPEDMEYLFLMALKSLIVAKKRFFDRYKELEAEDESIPKI